MYIMITNEPRSTTTTTTHNTFPLINWYSHIFHVVQTFFRLNYAIRLSIYLILYALLLMIVTPLPPTASPIIPPNNPLAHSHPTLTSILTFANTVKIKYHIAVHEPYFSPLIENIRHMNSDDNSTTSSSNHVKRDFWSDYPGRKGVEAIIGYAVLGRLYFLADEFHFFNMSSSSATSPTTASISPTTSSLASSTSTSTLQSSASLSPFRLFLSFLSGGMLGGSSRHHRNGGGGRNHMSSGSGSGSGNSGSSGDHHHVMVDDSNYYYSLSSFILSFLWYIVHVSFIPDYYFVFFMSWYRGYLFNNVFLFSYHAAVAVFMICFNIMCLLSGDWFWEYKQSQIHEQNRRQQRMQQEAQLAVLVRGMFLPELNNLHASINHLRSPVDYSRMNMDQLVNNEQDLRDQLDLVRYELVNRQRHHRHASSVQCGDNNHHGGDGNDHDHDNDDNVDAILERSSMSTTMRHRTSSLSSSSNRRSSHRTSSSSSSGGSSSFMNDSIVLSNRPVRFITSERCIICLDRKPDIYLKKCYHACMCRHCALDHVKSIMDDSDDYSSTMDDEWKQMISSYVDDDGASGHESLSANDEDRDENSGNDNDDDDDESIRFYNPNARLKQDLITCPMCKMTISGWGYVYQRSSYDTSPSSSTPFNSSNPYVTTTTAIELSKLTKYIVSNPGVLRKLRYWSSVIQQQE